MRVSRFLLVAVIAVTVLLALVPVAGAAALTPSEETGEQERRVAYLEDIAAAVAREIGAVTDARAGAWLQSGNDELSAVAFLNGRLERLEARRRALEEELKAIRLELDEPPVPSELEAPGVERWRNLVAQHFPASRVEEAMSIMDCESGGDPTARNPRSGAAGLYQFLPRTWSHASAQAGVGHLSVEDPEANIAAAAWLTEYSVSRGNRAWSHWTCRP